MGRTNETATQLIRYHQREMANLFSALRQSDKEVFRDLFAMAQHHIAPIAYSGAPEPEKMIYFAMLLEEHKLLMKLQKAVRHLLEEKGDDPSQWLDF
jgi:hypothetical protein